MSVSPAPETTPGTTSSAVMQQRNIGCQRIKSGVMVYVGLKVRPLE